MGLPSAVSQTLRALLGASNLDVAQEEAASQASHACKSSSPSSAPFAFERQTWLLVGCVDRGIRRRAVVTPATSKWITAQVT